jgi:AcrR family transcriptional regulator
MSGAIMGKLKAAQRIQSAAKELFYNQGIRATGVEEVCRVADATKMSLYRAFPSKDALVAAVLEEDAAAAEAWFREVIEAAPTPVAKLQAVIDGFAVKLTEPAFRGCPMMLAQAEFPDPEHPTHQIACQCKARMRDALVVLARQAGARDPYLLGETLAMLLDGAWASMAYLGGERAGEVLRRAAGTALRDALPAEA